MSPDQQVKEVDKDEFCNHSHPPREPTERELNKLMFDVLLSSLALLGK